MATHTAISLCTGVGMLDRGVDLALGGSLRPVLYVEREAFCVANLAWQMEQGYLAEAPIWSDVRTVASKVPRWCVERAVRPGSLGIIFGGIPCQPHSQAGKRAGFDDSRDLWPAMRRAVEVYEPRCVFVENVSGLLSSTEPSDGAGRILDELEGLGYSVACGLFSSEECGASHKRERVFILADRDRDGARELSRELRPDEGEREEWQANRGHGAIAGREDLSGSEVAGNGGERPDESFDSSASGGNFPRYAPMRNDFSAWATVAEMGASRMPSLESEVFRVADGLASRPHELRAIGNGVDPLVAAYAFVSLAACLVED